MSSVRTRVVLKDGIATVVLPKAVAFGEGRELVIVRSGDVMTIYPAATSIPAMIERLRSLPAPPVVERRNDEELPERRGT